MVRLLVVQTAPFKQGFGEHLLGNNVVVTILFTSSKTLFANRGVVVI